MRSTRLAGEPKATVRSRIQTPLTWMLKAWAVWIVFYFGGGLLALADGETGFFAATVDAALPLWLKLSVLNMPLHLVCMALSLALASAEGGRAQRASRKFGWAATLLAGSHVALSLAVAWLDLAGGL